MAFGDPISTSAPGYANKNNLVTQPSASSWWGPNIQFPYPTNTWFMDFVLPTTTELQNAGMDRRTSVWPYMVRAQNDGVAFNRPFIRKYPDGRTLRNEHQINYDPTATNWGWTSDQSPQIWRYLDLTFTSTESIASRYLDRYDQLTATLKWNVDATHYMEAPIVKGMPYVTMRYTGLTPRFETNNTDYHSITTVNGSAPSGTVSGTKFKLTVNRPYLGSGATETWIVYASSSISFTASASGLVATAPFTGYLRAAFVPTAAPSEETILDTYAHAVPVAGAASVSVSDDTSTTTFTYTKTGAGSTLLTYVFPHHEDTLSAANFVSNFSVTTIRGQLRAIIGNNWTMFDQLSTLTWDSPNAIDEDKQPAILTALATEKTFQASHLDATEAYIFGKQISRAARLALIAHQLGETSARDDILTAMKNYLNPWFDNDSSSVALRSLMYDTTWGGVIANSAHNASPAGNPQMANQEFGNAVYNDHYFHWGYFIYGAAVIAHFDPTWAASYQTKVNDVIRDIANPSTTDPHFTQLRHFDWYEGHSWAAGLQANGDGRNQESTSEAVNAWYGINLWGLATGQTDLHNVGRYLQAKETHAATLYWQMPSYNSVYPADFAGQKVIPLLFANKAFNGTWFGLSDDILVGIETLPFTPASHELLPKTWMQETFPAIIADNATPGTAYTPGGWLGYTYAAQAIIDPNAAYTNIDTNISLSDDNQYLDKFGASKTNLLWWSAVQGASGPAAISTITILDVDPTSPVDEGTTVTLTATISPAAAGLVTFRDGTEVIDTATVSGDTASITASSLSAGFHSLTATFAPFDTNSYTGSSSGTVPYTITTPGGGITGSNKSAVAYVGFSSGASVGSARMGVADTDYTATARDGIVGYTTLTASRTVTLPAAASVPAGWKLIIKDEAGNCSPSNTIVISGTIDGVSDLILSSAYADAILYSNGSAWFRI